MRQSAPASLLLVTLTYSDEPYVTVLGPFTSVSAMDMKLTAEPYPHGEGKPDVTIATFQPDTNGWRSPSGRDVLSWAAQSVDEARHRGCSSEIKKADYVVKEFSTNGV